jgi:hypothetical protein
MAVAMTHWFEETNHKNGKGCYRECLKPDERLFEQQSRLVTIRPSNHLGSRCPNPGIKKNLDS